MSILAVISKTVLPVDQTFSDPSATINVSVAPYALADTTCTIQDTVYSLLCICNDTISEGQIICQTSSKCNRMHRKYEQCQNRTAITWMLRRHRTRRIKARGPEKLVSQVDHDTTDPGSMIRSTTVYFCGRGMLSSLLLTGSILDWDITTLLTGSHACWICYQRPIVPTGVGHGLDSS